MKRKRYGINVRETALQPRDKQSNFQIQRFPFKAFNKCGLSINVFFDTKIEQFQLANKAARRQNPWLKESEMDINQRFDQTGVFTSIENFIYIYRYTYDKKYKDCFITAFS